MPSWLTNAAQGNISNAQSIAAQPYVGQQVAAPTTNQTNAWGQIANVAGGGNPYLSQIQNAYQNYGSAPASQISAPSVLGANVNPATASLSQYIDPNLQMELQPTLANIEQQREIGISGAGGVGSQATGQGGSDAFGDARAGVSEAQTNYNAMLATGQATGQAYQNAFTNAANLRGIDVSNLIGTQTTNAGLTEQALARALGSGQALQGLNTNTQQNQLTASGALNTVGQQQQAYNQAVANLPWLNNQGLQQFDLTALAGENAATGVATPAAGYNQTQTTQQPNNAGWALAGSLLGPLAGSAFGPLGTAIGSGLTSSIFGSGTLGTGGGKAGS